MWEICTDMRILITNDDGFNAAGIKSLRKVAQKITNENDIIVVAPSKNQSAKSRAVTYKTDFEITKKRYKYTIPVKSPNSLEGEENDG